MTNNISFVFQNNTNYRISSGYAVRNDPFTGQEKQHKGMDFAADYGTPVYAVRDGVILARNLENPNDSSQGFGNRVIINYDNDVYNGTYAHLSNFADGLSVGDRVSAGQLIGYVGNTGSSTGNHLHYEESRINNAGQKITRDPTADLLSAAGNIQNPIEIKIQDELVNGARNIVTTIQNFVTDIIDSITGEDSKQQVSRALTKASFSVNDGDSYTIKSGDSLSSIASSLHTTTQKLIDSNHWLTSENRISNDGNSILIKPGEKLAFNNLTNNSGQVIDEPFVYNSSLVQKNFASLGIGGNSFNITNNSFNNFTYIDTTLSFDASRFTNSTFNPSNSGFQIPNFQLSNPIKDAAAFLGSALNHASPLAIDLDNDGIESTNINETNIFFDIKNSGFANKIGWIKQDDGILALDKNHNGNIDNITELFGDYRQSAWDELKLLDSNQNNKIDAADTKFQELKIWRDLNQNGISEDGELKSLAEYNIKEIALTNIINLNQYQNENYISSKGIITYADNSTKQSIYDVHFLNDNLNTWFKGAQSEEFGNDFQVKVEALLLPLSRGYGDLPSLHIAMSKDDALLQMVKEFASLTKTQFDEIPAKLETILYRWASVDAVNPDALAEADGANIDARKLKFVEKFAGVQWQQLGNREVAGHFASLDIKKAWDGIFNEMLNRFLVQGNLQNVFTHAEYSFVQDKIILNDSYDAIISNLREYGVNSLNLATGISHIIYLNRVELGVSAAQINQDFLNNFGFDLKLNDTDDLKINWGTNVYYSDLERGSIQVGDENVLKKVASDAADNITASNVGDYIFAKGGDDVVSGGLNEDYIDGGAGNDAISGNGDNDWLVGGDGNDQIYGGEGRDKINGGTGSDTIFGDAGDDLIEGGAGSDLIDGGTGIDAITYYDSAVGITVNLKTATATGGDAQGDRFSNIENVHGSLSSDVITGNDQNNFLHGENGDDKIYGEWGDDILFNGFGKSRLYGGNGNDILMSYDGQDVLDGGEGVDTAYYKRPDINTRLSINLNSGTALYADRADTQTRYVVVLPIPKFYDYLNGLITYEQALIIVPDYEFYDMTADFRKTYGTNFYVDSIRNVIHKPFDTLKNIENIESGFYADQIIGNDQANEIHGNGGADVISGGGGNDKIFGDVNAEMNNQLLNSGYDLNFESDNLSGGNGNDEIYGGLGNDIIDGGAGNDILRGGIDNDTISGKEGNDIIDGGLGVDVAVYSRNQAEYDVVQAESGWTISHKNNGQDGVDQLQNIEKLQFLDNLFVFNNNPTALDISARVLEDNSIILDVLAQASDVDNDALLINSITNPSHGTSSIMVDGDGKQKILYRPNANFNGADHFDYTVSDGRGGIVTKTIGLNVGAVNDVPNATLAVASTDEDASQLIDVLALASDIDGDVLTISQITTPTHGTAAIVMNAQGHQTINYTPTANYNGPDSLNYTISDGNGGFVTKELTINIVPVSDAPTMIIAETSTKSATVGKTFSYKLNSANFSDADGDALEFTIRQANGTALPSWLTFNPETLELKGVPPINSYGLQKLSLIISDGRSETKSDFNIIVNKSQGLEAANADVGVISAAANGVITALNNGANLLVGNSANNTFQFGEDVRWGGNEVVYNSYNGQTVAIGNKIKSFDAFDGGAGYDDLKLTSGDDVLLLEDLTINASASKVNIANIEVIRGNGGNDIIDLSSSTLTYGNVSVTGNAQGNDVIWTNDGDDRISGYSGNDNLNGGRGNDTIMGGDGNDILDGFDGNDNIAGDNGADKITGGLGADTLTGGTSWDAFIYTSLNDSTISQIDTITDFEKGKDKIDLRALNFDSIAKDQATTARGLSYKFEAENTIISDANSDFAIKVMGNITFVASDFMFAYNQANSGVIGQIKSFNLYDGKALKLGAGNDTFNFNDLIINSVKNDNKVAIIESISGNGGNDIIDLSSSSISYGNVTINGNANVNANGDDTLIGNDGNDTINGFSGIDTIDGGRGNDTINAGDGNDIISGGAGNDIIDGGNGADRINGGLGADILKGGTSYDSFIYSSLQDSTDSQTDLILDFLKTRDKIDLSGLGFDSIAKDSAISAHGLTYSFDGTNTIIDDPNSDFSIKLAGEIELARGDFLFT